MQIKKKTQLKIELDQNDIVEAVRDFLLKHGQRISDAELAEIFGATEKAIIGKRLKLGLNKYGRD